MANVLIGTSAAGFSELSLVFLHHHHPRPAPAELL